MPKVSVITCTTRPDGLRLVQKALSNQDVESFEWIIVAPKNIKERIEKTLSSSYVFIDEPEKKEGDIWCLNKAYNAGIKIACAPLIVSWQDYTFAKSDTLQRFLTHFEQEPNILVGAVGNKYKTVYPELGAMVWADPRERSDQGTYYKTGFENIEYNLAAIPKKALYDIGGFDESLDKFFGMDGYGVNERINMLGGYDFALDQSIKSYSVVHDRPIDWEEKGAIHGPYQERQKYYSQNGPILSYLK